MGDPRQNDFDEPKKKASKNKDGRGMKESYEKKGKWKKKYTMQRNDVIFDVSLYFLRLEKGSNVVESRWLPFYDYPA